MRHVLFTLSITVISGSHSNVFCYVGIKTIRSCHLSVRRMNQTVEYVMKRVTDEITLLVADYLIFLQA